MGAAYCRTIYSDAMFLGLTRPSGSGNLAQLPTGHSNSGFDLCIGCRAQRMSWSACRLGGIAASAAISQTPSMLPSCSQSALIQGLSTLLAFGRRRAMYTGMLRITLPASSNSGAFILEGRLTGLWAQELLRVARGTNQSHGEIFDLQEVFYVDSAGEQALRLLSKCGAKFITESAYGKDLCHRLKLCRVITSKSDNNGKRSEGPRKSAHLPLKSHMRARSIYT